MYATNHLICSVADAVQQAVNRGQGNRARLLGGVLREIDAAMENASSGYLGANRNFEQASRNIEAVAQAVTAEVKRAQQVGEEPDLSLEP